GLRWHVQGHVCKNVDDRWDGRRTEGLEESRIRRRARLADAINVLVMERHRLVVQESVRGWRGGHGCPSGHDSGWTAGDHEGGKFLRVARDMAGSAESELSRGRGVAVDAIVTCFHPWEGKIHRRRPVERLLFCRRGGPDAPEPAVL